MRVTLRKVVQLLFLLFSCYVLYFIINLRRYNSSLDSVMDPEQELIDIKQPKLLIGNFWTPEAKKTYRSGPGENGEPVQTKPADESKKQESYSEYGFNQYVSDKISLERSIKDTRHEL